MRDIIKFNSLFFIPLFVFFFGIAQAGIPIWQVGRWHTSGEFVSSEKKIIDYKVPSDWGSLVGQDDVVIVDRLNHASIIDAAKLSKSKIMVYHHKDMGSLEKILKRSASYKKKLIVTDSLFSMDGDIAPLKDIINLAQQYEAEVMIDEAHATGVYVDVDDYTQRAPQAVAQHDEAVLFPVEKTLLLHQVLAVQGPALVQGGRSLYRTRPVVRMMKIRGNKLQVVPGKRFVHAGQVDAVAVVLR